MRQTPVAAQVQAIMALIDAGWTIVHDLREAPGGVDFVAEQDPTRAVTAAGRAN